MKPEKSFFQWAGLSRMILFSALLWPASCQTDMHPDSKPSNTTAIHDPDVAAQYLVLTGASQIAGNLPNAPDGHLKLNFKDTIYIARGFPFGARAVVKHDRLQDISGFYVGVSDGSFYYDVPAVEAEAGDSTDVIYINWQVPDGVSWESPYTIPIRIQPHSADGSPLDGFDIKITIEGNEGGQKDPCSPLTPAPTCYYNEDSSQYSCDFLGGINTWVWEFTVVEDATGDIYTAYAPFMFLNNPPFQHGGCCWNGISTPAKYDPYCVSGNPEYHEITVADVYYVRYYEFLDLFDNNTFVRNIRHETHNYSTDSSNYCTGEAGYITSRGTIQENGTHDFSLGDDNIHFKREHLYDYSNPDNPYNLWKINDGNMFYTCHTLIISYYFNGEKWSDVYQRNYRRDGIIDDSFQPEFYE